MSCQGDNEWTTLLCIHLHFMHEQCTSLFYPLSPTPDAFAKVLIVCLSLSLSLLRRAPGIPPSHSASSIWTLGGRRSTGKSRRQITYPRGKLIFVVKFIVSIRLFEKANYNCMVNLNRDYYFTDVKWISDSEVSVTWANRVFNFSTITRCQPPSYRCKEVSTVLVVPK